MQFTVFQFVVRILIALCDRVLLMLYERFKLLQLVVITCLILYLPIVSV